MKQFPPVALLLVVAIICSAESYSQSIRATVSMPYIGSGAYTTRQSDPFAFTGNQASLAQLKTPGAGIFTERRFLLAENQVYGLAAVFTTALGNVGVQLNYAGTAGFSENKVAIAYGRQLGGKADLGVQFNYYSNHIPGYKNSAYINFEIGVILHLSDKLNAGIHVYNPLGTKPGKGSKEELPSTYKTGFGYDASAQFYICAEMIKEEYKPVNVITSVRYNFAQQFFARTGFMTESGSLFAGAGMSWKKLRLDVSGSFHPQLGFSPGLLLIFYLKEALK